MNDVEIASELVLGYISYSIYGDYTENRGSEG